MGDRRVADELGVCGVRRLVNRPAVRLLIGRLGILAHHRRIAGQLDRGLVELAGLVDRGRVHVVGGHIHAIRVLCLVGRAGEVLGVVPGRITTRIPRRPIGVRHADVGVAGHLRRTEHVTRRRREADLIERRRHRVRAIHRTIQRGAVVTRLGPARRHVQHAATTQRRRRTRHHIRHCHRHRRIRARIVHRDRARHRKGRVHHGLVHRHRIGMGDRRVADELGVRSVRRLVNRPAVRPRVGCRGGLVHHGNVAVHQRARVVRV